jgi:hypothetical protein
LNGNPKTSFASTETQPATQAKAAPGLARVGRLIWRVASIIAMATVVGWLLGRSNRSLEASGGTAGFGRGIIHGALMPCAMPNLLMGRDVIIYATNNSGRTYKLGYTIGVNGCGAIFFGIFFWRLNRWRKSLQKAAAP